MRMITGKIVTARFDMKLLRQLNEMKNLRNRQKKDFGAETKEIRGVFDALGVTVSAGAATTDRDLSNGGYAFKFYLDKPIEKVAAQRNLRPEGFIELVRKGIVRRLPHAKVGYANSSTQDGQRRDYIHVKVPNAKVVFGRKRMAQDVARKHRQS